MIHLILQGKGGVGKSLIASLLAQYLMQRSEPLLCIDTDPVNDTFAQYVAFHAYRLPLINDEQMIDVRAFDTLIDKLLTHEGHAVVDNGASTFIPLSAYINSHQIIELFQQAGKTIHIHTILTGGQAMDDTLVGLQSLVESQPAPIVVWENEFFGDITKDGKHFVESKFYEKYKARLLGPVTLQKRQQETFGKDLENMIAAKMTFDEAYKSEHFGTMPKHRLRLMQRAIFDQLNTLPI